jgi:hypothetical protein
MISHVATHNFHVVGQIEAFLGLGDFAASRGQIAGADGAESRRLP